MKEVEIPAEIIEEILLRLPVKTLLRLKSVCNNWGSLIGSQYFIGRHLRHESNQECLVYHIRHSYKWGCIFAMHADDDDGRPPPHIEPPMPNSHRIVTLVGPVKGVFCAVSHLGLVVLSNPATREISPLPALLPSHYHPSLWQYLLVFGFGSDPLSGDLKLVSLCREGGRSTSSACVYNLSRGDSWKAVEDADSLKSMRYAYSSLCNTFLNGVYYWLISLVNDGDNAILAFDMRSDKFQEILQLPYCLIKKNKLQIAAHGESIALMSRERCKGGEYCVDLWVMGRRDGFWSKNFTIGPFEHKMVPLCMHKNEVVLEKVCTSALILCHVSTQKLRKVGPEILRCFVSAIYLYTESLVSTKREGDRADAEIHAHQIL